MAGDSSAKPSPDLPINLKRLSTSMKGMAGSSRAPRDRYADPELGDDMPLIHETPSAEHSPSHQRRKTPKPIAMRIIGSALPRKKETKSRTIPFFAADNAKSRYPANVVRNQKYNVITFLPIVFYEQFKFFFNLYFLLVALSQFIPALQIGYLITYFGPLCFVLTITMAKEAVDDYKRYLRDKEANSQQYHILTREGVRSVPSSRIRVGDLVVIRKDQRVPADVVLLRTTEPSGACFIRTDQLDGETDWKLRLAVPWCQRLPTDESLCSIRASVYADHPHKDIHNFVGNFTRHEAGTGECIVDSLGVENTLWSNTVLASGTSAIGFVVYTGSDTRAVMNTNNPETKVGLLDVQINRLSKILFVVTLALSIVMIALTGFRGLWYIYLFRFLILFSSIIPISLRVNLDMGKTVYSMQIMRDEQISGCIVRTSTIPEELGRIEYLLSDKTGTLTQNDMELKKLHLGTMSYTQDTMDEITSHLSTAFTSPAGRRASHDYQQPGRYKRPARPTAAQGGHGGLLLDTGARHGARHRDIGSRVKDIVLALALCHNVTPVEGDHGETAYQASSPDEVAIVKWTESVGLTLVHRDVNSIRLRVTAKQPGVHLGQEMSFDVLHVFPFTSETKRMGIIVRDRQTGEVTFYEKGADAVVSKIVQYNDWLDEECGNMAREGLRTLVIARKRLSEEAYRSVEARLHAARTSIHDRAGQIQQCQESLEHDLELLGVTGVEDKLQDDVKPTLELLRDAGLKIWMLTGDKIETATCIAVSSKLVARNQDIYTVAKLSNPGEAQEELEVIRSKNDCCLVIDGSSVQLYLDHYRDEFIALAIRLPIVVCCRCSPTQKADITSLIKTATGKRVAAIGDGGNDVSMIQAAHVGIGIPGKEGKQASLAADFSVNQFSHIGRLFLWHGRNSYKRSAKLSQFVIHRGLIISVIQAVFSAMFYFAPIALYQGFLLVGYSTIYTMAPVFSLVLDRDVDDETALRYPELYKDLIKGRSLSYKTFFTWLLISVYQGGAIMMLAMFLFEDEFLNIVSISFTSLIFNELLMVALEINTWHAYMIWSEIMTLLVYLGSMTVLKAEFDLTFILTWAFVWKVAVITAVSSIPLYIFKYIRRLYAPPSYSKLT